MPIRSGLFNSVNGDRKYDASFFAEYFATFIANGVFPNPSNGFQVMANGDMTVALKAGQAWIKGYYVTNDADYNMTIDVADGTLNRIDRVVLQLNYLNREITPIVKKGTFASSPVAPTLQRDADAYEIALADIYVGNGVLSIIQANITDQRLNTELCGVVHGLIDQVDTTTIFNQYQSWFGDFTVAKQADFDAWIASLQDILSGDVAGNLANQITTLQQDFAAHTADYLYQTAGGTATAITLTGVVLEDGHPKTFIASANNGGAATTINGKPLYKPNTTTAPTLILGKAYTVWYNIAGTCFFIKASAEGTATTAQVLAGVPFSNETDTGLVGTMPNKIGSATVIIPSGSDQAIPQGYYDGNTSSGKVSAVTLTPGENVIYTSADQANMQGTTMNKKLELQITGVGGTVRVKFDVTNQPLNYTANMQIYINGVARGTLRTLAPGGGTPTYSEDFTINPNDLIQLYTSNGSSSGDGLVKNLRVCNSFPYATFNG